MKGFTENTRVQVPAAMQLCRLGYEYLDNIRPEDFDASTNILTGIFTKAFLQLNPGLTDADAKSELQKLILAAANDDLGREFYSKLMNETDCRLIDFENPDNTLETLYYFGGGSWIQPFVIDVVQDLSLKATAGVRRGQDTQQPRGHSCRTCANVPTLCQSGVSFVPERHAVDDLLEQPEIR